MLMSEIRISIDGAEFSVTPGVSIAAALMSHDVVAWRTTRQSGSPRGTFCGIGACFDCLVTVNGQPNIRACIDFVRDGDVIDTATHGKADAS